MSRKDSSLLTSTRPSELRSTSQALYGRYVQQYPSPCDDCVLHSKCKYERLACRQFTSYVRNGRVLNGQRVPNKHCFDVTFPNKDDKLDNQKHKPTRPPRKIEHKTVRLVRSMAKSGYQQKEIAEYLDIHKNTVSDIVRRKTYEYIE